MGDERTLRRIIALLVAFAALAERAAGRCSVVRWLVLFMLRQAETVAEQFVFEETGLPPPAAEGFAAVGSSPADALRLAVRFHALAAALAALLPLASLRDRRPARRRLASGHVAAASSGHPAGWRPQPNDTS